VLGMKTLILIVAVTITAAAVPFGVIFGQTKPDREPADIPSELLAALQKDLNEDKDAKACLEEPDNPPLEGQVAASWIDLDLNSPHCF